MVIPADLPYEFHPDAEQELLEAARWYFDRDPKVGIRFRQAIDLAIERIVDAPHRWARHRHGTQRFLLRHFPYGIVYRLHHQTIQIMAVCHLRRHPDYWKDRL